VKLPDSDHRHFIFITISILLKSYSPVIFHWIDYKIKMLSGKRVLSAIEFRSI